MLRKSQSNYHCSHSMEFLAENLALLYKSCEVVTISMACLNPAIADHNFDGEGDIVKAFQYIFRATLDKIQRILQCNAYK